MQRFYSHRENGPTGERGKFKGRQLDSPAEVGIGGIRSDIRTMFHSMHKPESELAAASERIHSRLRALGEKLDRKEKLITELAIEIVRSSVMLGLSDPEMAWIDGFLGIAGKAQQAGNVELVGELRKIGNELLSFGNAVKTMNVAVIVDYAIMDSDLAIAAVFQLGLWKESGSLERILGSNITDDAARGAVFSLCYAGDFDAMVRVLENLDSLPKKEMIKNAFTESLVLWEQRMNRDEKGAVVSEELSVISGNDVLQNPSAEQLIGIIESIRTMKNWADKFR